MDKQAVAEQTVSKLSGRGTFSKWLGIQVKMVKPGSVTLQMTVRSEMLNGLGVAHGGIAFSLADTALGFASNSHGTISMAVENNISYLQKIREGDLLTATTEELSQGKRIGVYRITDRPE
ncbi:MAG: hotdog fold thioesterase [Balneolaceae bacterium]|nr:hotdog fold thioesterase [Balneolaceae bacterium]